jgi:L-ribulose-5-phosphate 3-epimerase
MLLGYNTNGFAHHRLADALTVLSEIGYRSVALTLEGDHLDPPDARGVAGAVELIKPLIETGQLRVTIESGSRFILDPHRKHQPTLISASLDGRRRRIEFLRAAIDVAASLPADSVALWSGSADDEASDDELFTRLVASLSEVIVYAEAKNVRLAFEPEPGMFIDTMARLERLFSQTKHPLLGLTLDVGHVHCLNDGDLGEHVQRWRDRLWNVHIEDMRRGAHEHLMFGDGDVDFASVFNALAEIDYAGPVHVELSRHSHDAVAAARRSFDFLRSYPD